MKLVLPNNRWLVVFSTLFAFLAIVLAAPVSWDWIVRSVRVNRLQHDPLAPAVVSNLLGEVNVMLDRFKRDPNEKMPDGSTPLIYAVRNGRLQIVELLLRYHANNDAKDRAGRTACDWAREQKNHELVALLCRDGPDQTRMEQSSPPDKR